MTHPASIDGALVAEDIPMQTVLRGRSGSVHVRCSDWRPDGYPEYLPPFTFTTTDTEGHGGMSRTLGVEDDGPLEVIWWPTAPDASS